MGSNSKAVVSWRQRAKLRSIIYKGGRCLACSYNRCVSALTFHHLNPKEKDFQIGSGTPKAWKTMRLELDKCVLLCRNCHAEVHADVLSLDLILFANPTPSEGEAALKKLWKNKGGQEDGVEGQDATEKEGANKICADCGGRKRSNSALCRTCRDKTRRGRQYKIQWPPTEELEAQISASSYCAVGRALGVSDNAVRKHLKQQKNRKMVLPTGLEPVFTA